MYNMTGIPGWMRFGYSPGWVGRSASGLGPCAEYMMTGQWPNPMMAQAMDGAGAQMPMAPNPWMAGGYPQPDRAQMAQMIQAQIDMLQQQIEMLAAQIDEL